MCHISLKFCVHLLIWQQAFFSGANLYIFSSQELWVGVLPDFNNLVISLLADNEAIWIFFCKYLSGRVSFIFHCTKMFEDKLAALSATLSSTCSHRLTQLFLEKTSSPPVYLHVLWYLIAACIFQLEFSMESDNLYQKTEKKKKSAV